MTKGFDIPPDAVKIWRGYRAAGTDVADFYAKLSTVFVPATVELQIAAGLDGYIPSVLAGLQGKPESVPDETAIMFWDSQQTYRDSFDRLAVRTYMLTHGSTYRAPSGSQFPIIFQGAVAAEQPYYLIPQPADWMHGKVSHLIGGRPPGVTPEAFRAKLAVILSDIQRQAHVAGAIVCAGDDYLSYWELDGPEASVGISALAAELYWSQRLAATPTRVKSGLWDDWQGMAISAGASLNMQFRRRWEGADRHARPVPADAVRVWRAYRSPSVSPQAFRRFVGQVSTPACALLQPGAGLHAYVLSMLPEGGGDGMPDLTALSVWADQETYAEAPDTVAGRASAHLQCVAYDSGRSRAGFPVFFTGEVKPEQPYHLFQGPADWMLGAVRHFVGARRPEQSADDFLRTVASWVASYRRAPPRGVDAAIVCAGPDYVAFWEHATPGSPSDLLALQGLAALAAPRLSRTAETYVPPSDLCSPWPGVDLDSHDCINIQLARPAGDPFRPLAP